MIGDIVNSSHQKDHYTKRWQTVVVLTAVLMTFLLTACTPVNSVRVDCSHRNVDVLISAQCRFQEGDVSGALADYRKAATAQNLKPKVATKLLENAEKLAGEWKLLDGRDYLDVSLAISRQLSDKALIGRNLLQLGETAYRLGDYSKAKSYMDQAQPYLEKSRQSILAIRNKNNTGNALNSLGRFDEAEAALDAALQEAREENNKAHIAQSLNNIGVLRYNLRRYASAMEAIQESESNAKAANNARLIMYAALLKGAVLRQQSDFAAAYREYQRSLTIASRYPKELKHELGSAKRVISELLIYTPIGDHKKNLALAEQYLKDVLVLHRDNPVEVGLALNHLGEIALERGKISLAVKYFEQGLKNYQSLEFPDGIGRAHINLGRAYNADNNYQKAIVALNKADKVYTSLEDREWLRVGLYERGLANERLGQGELAEQDYKSSVDHLESIRGDVHGDQSAQELFTEVNADVYERLVSLLMEKGDIEGALEYIERSRLRALDEYLMQGRGGTDPDTPLGGERDKVAKAGMSLVKARELREEAAKSASSGGQKVRNLINTAAKDFQGRYKKTAKVSLKLGMKSIDMAELKKLPSDIAVITYFPTPKAIYIIVSRGGQKPVGFTIKELNKGKLRTQVIAALSYLHSGKSLLSTKSIAAGKNDTEYGDILKTLYETFISPVESAIEGTKTLVIYPHDFLVFLPFEALVSPEKKYLVESKRVVYLHSIDGESNLTSLGAKQASFNFQSAVVFADPSPLPTGQSPLPHAKNEAAKIKLNFPESLILEGNKATKQAFQEQWGKHEIVHVAAHGEATPDEAALFLASGTAVGEDGKLTEDDISDLDNSSRKTKLVILSACETAVDVGLAQVDPDDPVGSLGLAGMVHLFSYYHSVPSRIGSLWKVNDAKTATLMGDMYKNMNGQGKNKVPYDAFRAAQLAMIKRGGISRHPYFWAGFIYFGVPG